MPNQIEDRNVKFTTSDTGAEPAVRKLGVFITGPSGIGKSTLIRALKSRNTEAYDADDFGEAGGLMNTSDDYAFHRWVNEEMHEWAHSKDTRSKLDALYDLAGLVLTEMTGYSTSEREIAWDEFVKAQEERDRPEWDWYNLLAQVSTLSNESHILIEKRIDDVYSRPTDHFNMEWNLDLDLIRAKLLDGSVVAGIGSNWQGLFKMLGEMQNDGEIVWIHLLEKPGLHLQWLRKRSEERGTKLPPEEEIKTLAMQMAYDAVYQGAHPLTLPSDKKNRNTQLLAAIYQYTKAQSNWTLIRASRGYET